MISNKLLEMTFDHFNKNKNKNVVVSPSLPILYFGDLNSYRKSELKIISVGKNPSDNEFRMKKTELFSFVRFSIWDESKQNLIDSLNPYFEDRPLRQWFSSFEPILNGLTSSYYKNKYINTALHTDICSPLATDPTWSKLPTETQAELYKDGVEIWKELIEELQPDVMLVSIPRILFESVFNSDAEILVVFNIKKDGKPRQAPYVVNLHQYKLKNGKNVKVVFGQARNKPFDTISAQQKKLIGELCLK
jgi:hypothetical protein